MTWDLARGEAFLPRVSLGELKRLMAAEPEAKPRLRFLIALHRKQGKSLDEIAEACAVPRRTAHGTIERFCDRGLNAAHDAEKEGRPNRLTSKQLIQLKRRLLRSPKASGFSENFWTTRMVIKLVEREFGVLYTPQWMWTLLRKLGFSSKKPRPMHYKSSPLAREEFKKKRGEKSLAPSASAEPRFAWTKAPSSSNRTRREAGLSAASQQ